MRADCCAADLESEQPAGHVGGGGVGKRMDEESAAGTCHHSHPGRSKSSAGRAGKAGHSGAHAEPTRESLCSMSLRDEGDG